MTIAVVEALIATIGESDDIIKAALVDSMQKWGKKYPNAGYGCMFSQWLGTPDHKTYGSFGNGAAMRVAAAGWLFDDIETTRHIAALTSEVTHNHPEGIKGAEATASAIFLARKGKCQAEIKDYIIKEFITTFPEPVTRYCQTIIMWELVRKQFPKQLLLFWKGMNLKMLFEQLFLLVATVILLPVFQVVLQKRSMKYLKI